MAVIDIQVIPVGTATPSVSNYVADIQRLLTNYKSQKVIDDYVLTPMNTQIQGELKNLLEVVAAIHEVPFESNIQRVCTNIRIDDRRDKKLTLASKIEAVKSKM